MKKRILLYFVLLNTAVFSQSQYVNYRNLPDFENTEQYFYNQWELNPADFANKLSDVMNQKKLNKRENIQYLIDKKQEVTIVKIMINGLKFSESGYKKGLLDGTKVIYHDNGAVFQEIEYKNGKANGITKVYNEKGKLVLETNYKDNLKNGLRKLTDPRNNRLVIEGNYENDNVMGDLKVIYRNDVYTYPNDLRKGKVKYFTEDRLISEYEILNQNRLNGEAKDYNPKTGKLSTKTPYYLGDVNGFKEYYDINGDLQYKNEYKFNNKVGEHKLYLYDKTLISEEYYDKDGLKIGVWRDYERSGVMRSEKVYVNDQLEGVSKEFKNGILVKSEEFHNNKRNGAVRYFEEKTGVLKTESLYKNEVRQNEKQYYPEGMVLNETNFSNEGKKLSVRYFNREGKLLSENKWGENGMPVGIHKTYSIDRENKLYLDTEIQYNEKGEQIVNTNFNSYGGYTKKHLKNGKWHGATTIYNGKTNSTEEIYYFQSKKVTKEEFEKLDKQ
ncbi:toxin-antitoxin system YwqK family antitoxin [Flavobacterium panacagri]|uniref:toxin-antitoxin system YwqK family antitoxin n=1 Tax=Flavobacterium panacagri TaxID=3034146 RepID=UPI0025A63256|nr:hypothetical protein [Flavobacterium panacagri]